MDIKSLLPLEFALMILISTMLTAEFSFAADKVEPIVYSVYSGLNMGNEGEITKRDYYLNVGTNQGVKNGSIMKVYRKAATYDLLNKKLHKDMIFPIARVRIIHAEGNASIARLVKFLDPNDTPAIEPSGIVAGDLVQMER